MRLFKAFFAGLTGLAIAVTLFSLLFPSNVRVTRSVLINKATAPAVYREISNFENWKKWHPVFTRDSAILYSNPPGISGSDPRLRIMHRNKEVDVRLLPTGPTSVKFLLEARGENDIANDIVITSVAARQSVLVEWRAVTKLQWYPWEKFYAIFIDKLTGPGYEEALNGLKEYMEKSPLSP